MGSEGGIEGAHDSCSQLFVSQMQAAVSSLAMIAITHPIRSNHGITALLEMGFLQKRHYPHARKPGGRSQAARVGEALWSLGRLGLPAEVPPWCPLTPGRKPEAPAESKPG